MFGCSQLEADMSSSKKINVGIIGAGTWAEYGHIPALKLLDEYVIKGIYSRDQAKADEIARNHGIELAFSDVNNLVSHPDIDLILVLTPAPQHADGIEAAILAGKAVYSEWPLTNSTARSKELVGKAKKAGVRHLAGLQRRLAPDYRYIRDLIAEGYIGDLRSVRLHISVEYFKQLRTKGLYYTVPAENHSSLLDIYGGHYFDVLFQTFGQPKSLVGLAVNQFKTVKFIETGEEWPHSGPDQAVVSGQLENGAVYTVHLEAGKNNNYGMQLDISGSAGDLKLTNVTSFGEPFSLIQGAQGEGQELKTLTIPRSYDWLPTNKLGASVAELANLYAAYANDVKTGSSTAPTFEDAIAMHDFIDNVELSHRIGSRINLG
jgi:predicted dehydrogenase